MLNTSIPAIGTSIWARIVKPGLIVELPDGNHLAVNAQPVEGYSTVTLTDGVRTVTVDYADQVKVLGYFNP